MIVSCVGKNSRYYNSCAMPPCPSHEDRSSFKFSVSAFLISCCFFLIIGVKGQGKPTLVLEHVNVIAMSGEPVQADMYVVIEGSRIVHISKISPGGASARTINATGKFLIPGLWDMHVHMIFGDWIPKDENVTLPLFVANGITGVRDMGGDLDALKMWRTEIEAGKLLGPRMLISGPMLDGPVPRFPSSAPVKNASDGKNTVDKLHERGADFIKIQSLIPRDGYFAAAQEANR